MNEKFMNFIQKHNINIDEIYDELRIYSERDINPIIANNKLVGKTSKELVSIADIIGYDYGWRELTNNLANNFSNFFGEGSSYQTRSNGMLNYSNEEIIEKLYQSFKNEPMKILELDNGRKVVSSNGMHRYTVLRLHYISELQKVKGNKEAEDNLKSKYEIPVEITKVDLLKTYCRFMIKMVSQDSIYVSNHYDEKYKRTGKTELSNGKENIILSDEELLDYTKNLIKNIPNEMIEWFINKINVCSENYSSFKLFIDTNFANEINLLLDKSSIKRGGRQ